MIRPLPGYVLIRPLEQEEQSSGGVYLPEASKDKPMKGKVLACGIGKEKCPVIVDDITIYKKWTNQEVQHKGKTYLLVKFDELLGVIE